METSPVNTKAVTDRRSLRFDSPAIAIADADRLAAAERGGQLQQLGNWTLGQNLNHLATWADYSYDGAPTNPPAPIRWIARLLKNQLLNSPMRPGSRIPRIPGGTLAIEVMPTEPALEHFRRSFTRQAAECPARPHLLLGPLTHDQWIASHMRHAELHLSFLRDGGMVLGR